MLTLHEDINKTQYSARYEVSTHPRQAKEVCIAVGASLGTVDLVKVFERELEFSSKGFDSALELAFGKW